MTSEQELRESIIKQIEDVLIKQTEGAWQMPFTVNQVKDLVRGKQVYPWAYMFEMLLAKARKLSRPGFEEWRYPIEESGGKFDPDFKYSTVTYAKPHVVKIADLEQIIELLTCPTK